MDDEVTSQRYYPEEENVPLSEAVLEAARTRDDASLTADRFDLYEHVDPESLDTLFTDPVGTDISVRIDLPDVSVTIWSDGGIDIRVDDR